MTRVLVTGGTGYVGERATALLLAAGHEVHVASRRRPVNAAAHWHETDLLRDPAAAARAAEAEMLLHLAWVTEHGSYWRSAENLDWVGASLGLLRAFTEAGGRRAVIAGTCAEYDWARADEPLDEVTAAIGPQTLYGAAKAGLHRVAAAYAAQEDRELAWARIFFPYGEGEDERRLVTGVAARLLRGEPAETTDGTQVRDFVHVDDVAGALAALCTSPVTGPVNLGSGTGVAVGDLIDLVAAEVGRPELVRRGALPARPDDPPLLVASVRRLHEEVGFRPGVDLATGVRRTVDALRGA